MHPEARTRSARPGVARQRPRRRCAGDDQGRFEGQPRGTATVAPSSGVPSIGCLSPTSLSILPGDGVLTTSASSFLPGGRHASVRRPVPGPLRRPHRARCAPRYVMCRHLTGRESQWWHEQAGRARRPRRFPVRWGPQRGRDPVDVRGRASLGDGHPADPRVVRFQHGVSQARTRWPDPQFGEFGSLQNEMYGCTTAAAPDEAWVTYRPQDEDKAARPRIASLRRRGKPHRGALRRGPRSDRHPTAGTRVPDRR